MGVFLLIHKIMNIIYLNKALKYCEAFPDSNGQIIIREESLIVAFVEKGKVYALNDTRNILTPFEVFCQFNDMSVNFIEPHHFQQENRIIDLKGSTFCETKEVFNCVAYRTEVQKLHDYKKATYPESGVNAFDIYMIPTINGEVTGDSFPLFEMRLLRNSQTNPAMLQTSKFNVRDLLGEETKPILYFYGRYPEKIYTYQFNYSKPLTNNTTFAGYGVSQSVDTVEWVDGFNVNIDKETKGDLPKTELFAKSPFFPSKEEDNEFFQWVLDNQHLITPINVDELVKKIPLRHEHLNDVIGSVEDILTVRCVNGEEIQRVYDVTFEEQTAGGTIPLRNMRVDFHHELEVFDLHFDRLSTQRIVMHYAYLTTSGKGLSTVNIEIPTTGGQTVDVQV
jgi:hypothetical protein